jgi:hypothetical protein
MKYHTRGALYKSNQKLHAPAKNRCETFGTLVKEEATKSG